MAGVLPRAPVPSSRLSDRSRRSAHPSSGYRRLRETLRDDRFMALAPFDQPLQPVAQLDRCSEAKVTLGLLRAADPVRDERLALRLVLDRQGRTRDLQN